MGTKKRKASELLNAGMQPKDVAVAVGVSYYRLSKWQRDPEFMVYAAEQSRIVDEFIFAKARERLNELLDSDDEKTLISAIKIVYGHPSSHNKKIEGLSAIQEAIQGVNEIIQALVIDDEADI